LRNVDCEMPDRHANHPSQSHWTAGTIRKARGEVKQGRTAVHARPVDPVDPVQHSRLWTFCSVRPVSRSTRSRSWLQSFRSIAAARASRDRCRLLQNPHRDARPSPIVIALSGAPIVAERYPRRLVRGRSGITIGEWDSRAWDRVPVT